MSRFFSSQYASLTPYTPGEQPRDQVYVKLNTNESPFPPSPLAQEMAAQAAAQLQLYSDPTCKALAETAARYYGISEDEILFTNGSDDILNFAFMSFGEPGIVFPEITYGFYPVFAQLNGISCRTIPLKEDLTIRAEDYIGLNQTIVIANPNAPTGCVLTLDEIETILRGNPGNVVVIDEAYVDFGAESAVGLIHKYDNLLVTQTFSKSRSLAGGRLGMGIGCKALIRDLNTLKYSTNPYNINRMTMAAGIGALEDDAYFKENCRAITQIRSWAAAELKKMGFAMTDSMANFLFARHPAIPGKELYLKLKERGVLVRHFDTPALTDYNRITVGSREQMQTLLAAISSILEERL